MDSQTKWFSDKVDFLTDQVKINIEKNFLKLTETDALLIKIINP